MNTSTNPAPAETVEFDPAAYLAKIVEEKGIRVIPDAEFAEAKAAAAEAEQKNRARQLLGSAQCPARALRFLQRHANPWGDPNGLLARTHDRLTALKARVGGTTCAIYGDQGTGKTILGVDLIRQAAQEGRSGRYATIVDLVVDLKDAEKNGKLVQAIAYWKSVDILVVDQWDKNGMAEWEGRLVFAILDGRHAAERVTVIIGNCIKAADGYTAEFSRQLGASIVQRIQETGEFVLASWARFRPTSPEVVA